MMKPVIEGKTVARTLTKDVLVSSFLSIYPRMLSNLTAALNHCDDLN